MGNDNPQRRQLNFLLPISTKRAANSSGPALTQAKIEESRKRLLEDLKRVGI